MPSIKKSRVVKKSSKSKKNIKNHNRLSLNKQNGGAQMGDIVYGMSDNKSDMWGKIIRQGTKNIKGKIENVYFLNTINQQTREERYVIIENEGIKWIAKSPQAPHRELLREPAREPARGPAREPRREPAREPPREPIDDTPLNYIGVVIHPVYGGFDLDKEDMIKLYGKEDNAIIRHDKRVVDLVKKKKNIGKYEKLSIIYIPEYMKEYYKIDEYDGLESLKLLDDKYKINEIKKIIESRDNADSKIRNIKYVTELVIDSIDS